MVAAIDFLKAFDSITPNSICDALKTCGIEHEYINFFKRLYKNLKATVMMTEEESDMFEIKKGTKQGDPLSSFNLERRHSTLAKEERNGYLPWRQRSRLPHEYALC